MMKYCTKCQEEKPRESFYRAAHTKDGLQGYCRSCMRSYHTEWRKETNQGRNLLKKGYEAFKKRLSGGAA